MIKIVDDVSGPVLVVDGETLEGTYVRRLSPPRKGSFHVSVHSEAPAARLAKFRFANLPQEIGVMELSNNYSLIRGEREITQEVTVYRNVDGQMFMSFEFGFLADDWKRLWSIAEYRTVFLGLMKERNLTNGLRTLSGFSRMDVFVPEDDEDDYYIDMLFPVQDTRKVIDVEIRGYSELLTDLHNRTNDILLSRIRSESVVLQFDFPEDVRVACEQYLLYFVQFLKDLGVDATAELQHYAGEVLFAVTPKDKTDALDKIRTALETYLRLPMNDFSGGGETSITVQRLASNIYHLRGQLALAQAVLEAKDATIEAQRVTINQQPLPQLDGEIMVSSIKEEPPPPADSNREEVLDGMAEITKYEGKGFAVNLPEIYRRLKRLFDEKE